MKKFNVRVKVYAEIGKEIKVRPDPYRNKGKTPTQLSSQLIKRLKKFSVLRKQQQTKATVNMI